MNTVTSKDGTTLVFDRSGQGPALIFVTGAMATRSDAASLAAILSPHFTVFAYDRRGRGESGDTPPYAVEREIEDLQAVIDAAGGAAYVFGHSSGAVLALEAAARLTGITRLAVYEPPFILDDSRPPLPPDFAARLAGLLSSGRRGDMLELFMTQGVGVPVEVVAQMRNSPGWPAMEAIAHTLIYDMAILGDSQSGRPLSAEWSGRLASIQAPTLVMAGGASPAWQHTAVEAVAGAIPGAQLRVLAGQTHGAANEVLAPVLEAFFGG